MGGLYSSIFGKAKTPIANGCERAKNVFKYHFRGIFGVVPPLIAMAGFYSKDIPHKTLGGIWFWMFWYLLFQPIPQNAVGIIPLFALPIFGVVNAGTIVPYYINDQILFFVLMGWMNMILNCANLDKRIACCLLSLGGDDAFGPVALLFKAMAASFLLAMLCCRHVAIPNMLDILMPPLLKLESPTSDINYTEFIAILCNAIATSSIIGSMCVIHGSVTTLQFRTLCAVLGNANTFNYLQYSAFAIPVAISMFLFNMLYHFLLVRCCVKAKMSKTSKKAVSTAVTDTRKDLGKYNNFHNWIAPILLAMCWSFLFTRYSVWLQFNSWSLQKWCGEGLTDATVAALFVIISFLIPKTFNFFKICKKDGKDAPLKVESGVLFWKYVDKYTDYSYIFIFGAGITLYQQVALSGLKLELLDLSLNFMNVDWIARALIIVFTSVLLANIMSGVAAQAMLLPFYNILGGMASKEHHKKYALPLAIGLSTGFGMVGRFRDTPSYFTVTKGKVSKINQIKYGIASAVICALILSVALCFYGPIIFENSAEDTMGNPVATPVP